MMPLPQQSKLCKRQRRNQNPFFITCSNELHTTEMQQRSRNTFQNSRLLQTRLPPENADSWPASIDDHQAREDWGWKHEFDLEYDG
jgi:hypothetical protein